MYILYENFNTTNQTQPRFEAHENFVSDIKAPGCSLVETLPFYEQCEYVNNEEFCVPEFKLVNFLAFFYCTLAPNSKISKIYSIALLCVILSYYFLMLGLIADKYFCPALTMISKKLHMSEALAGVTLLAFGNGAPDLFTAMSSLNKTTEIGLQYGELVGAASFITSVVAGSIIIVKPFNVFPLTVSRDYLFIILAILYIDTILATDHLVSMAESIGVIAIYFVYILTVCIDQYLLSQSVHATPIDVSQISYERQSAELEVSKKSSMSETTTEKRNISVIGQFIDTVNPIKLDEWKESNFIGKLCRIIQLPFIALALIIPVADFDKEYDGWSKLLNCFHVVIYIPVLYYLLFENIFPILNIYTIGIAIAVMMPVGCFVFLKTKVDEKPKQHFIFAIMAASLAIGFIASVADEIICILMVLGVVLNADLSFLGCTLLAWGNSIGDLVTNITLAKQGYHKMGFAACTGGPLFNVLMSCGITFMYKSYHNPGTNTLSSGALSTTNTIFLLIILCFTLFAFLLTDFQARRSIGILLILLYTMLFGFTISPTLAYFHAYGTDHSEEAGF